MSEYINRNDGYKIAKLCEDLLSGNRDADAEPLEDEVAREYGDMGSYWFLPFAFELIEQGKSAIEANDIIFPENNLSITREELILLAAERQKDKQQELQLEEEEEDTISNVECNTFDPLPESKEKSKPRQRLSGKSESLSAQAQPIYERLYANNSSIKNVEAQRVIAEELGIDCPKKKNSLRALVVRWKKMLKEKG